MDKPFKVLQVIGSMDAGGAETMIMNIYREIDKSKIQFDFLVSIAESSFYEDEIKQLGGDVYHTEKKSQHLLRFCIDLYQLIKMNKYSVVHVHTSSSLAAVPIFIAMCARVKKRIVHSHNSNTAGNKHIHKLMRVFLNAFATYKFSCSDKASEWMYGREKKEAVIINNPIDCTKFKFNEQQRINVRNSLELQNKKVYVHVGRFSEQKNHKFLIDVFNEIYKIDFNSVLLLIGEGDLQTDIESQVEAYDLKHAVRFLGIQKNVYEILNACDAFIFPSLYEGLPLTLIEAQANGLPCFISDVISDMVDATDLIARISLQDGHKKWAEVLCSKTDVYSREKYAEILEKNFDVKYVSNTLISKYLEKQ